MTFLATPQMAPHAKAVVSVTEEGDTLYLRFTDSSTMAINRAKLREIPLPTSLKRLVDSDMNWAGLPEVDISHALRELVEVGERLLQQQAESIRGISSNLPTVDDEFDVDPEHMATVVESLRAEGPAMEPLVSTPKATPGFTPTSDAGQIGRQSLSAFRQHRLNEWTVPDRAFKYLDERGQAAVRMLESLETLLLAFFDEHARVPNVLIARREWYRIAKIDHPFDSAMSADLPTLIIAPSDPLLPSRVHLSLISDRDIEMPAMRYLADPYAYVPIYEKRRRAQEAAQADFRLKNALDTVAPVGPCVVRPRERRIVLDQPGETE